VSVHVKVAGKWQAIGGGGSGGPTWAKVTGGTVTEYTKPDGSVMEVHTFTADGTLTVDTPGYADVLVLSHGGGGIYGNAFGAGASWVTGLHPLPAGAVPVVIGGTDVNYKTGFPSSLGTIKTQGGLAYPAVGQSADFPGLTSSITGTPVEYAKPAQATPRANFGDGGGAGATSTSGSTGIVIVAVQKSAPTVSGVVASGGTESTYTGDGVNGVLGQNYKVHKFTASSNLTITTGGTVDVLIVGGGGGGGNSPAGTGDSVPGGGGGGGVVATQVTATAGTHAVTVGGGGAGSSTGNTLPIPDSNGGISALFGIVACGGGGGARQTVEGFPGASGGGGSGGPGAEKAGGTAIFDGQGYRGGTGFSGSQRGPGGGGGAGGEGQSGSFAAGGNGGPGRSSALSGTVTTYGGGGGGGGGASTPGTGTDGGGNGGTGHGTSAVANRGGGGGGGAQGLSGGPFSGGAGGSGIVIVRYKVA
jgi:hypothetical protein